MSSIKGFWNLGWNTIETSNNLPNADSEKSKLVPEHIEAYLKHILLFKTCHQISPAPWQYPLTSKLSNSYSYESCQSLLEFSYRVAVHNREVNDNNINPVKLDPPNFDIAIPLNTTFLLEKLNVLWFFYSSTMNIAVIAATTTYTNVLFLTDANYPQLDPILITNYQPNMKIHGGFWNFYAGIRSDLFDLLEKYVNNDTQILITGLSLGGAISTIIALDIYKHKLQSGTIITDIVHYSFASPRVFNTSGSNSYNELQIPSHRICNGSDIITSVPFPLMPSASIETFMEEDFTHVNGIVYFDRNLCDYYDNHIPAYLDEYNVTPLS